MQVIKYEEILDTLGELDTWLTGLGIEPKHDRIHKALDSLRKAQTNTEKVKAGEEPERIDNAEEFYFGIVEALDFYDIYRAFKNEPAKVLRPKLEVALSGPFLPRDETKENSAGRNTMFELSLAAEWRLLGLQVDIGEPDITLTLDKTPFLVECKRPFRESSIRPNVREAARQLGEKLERAGAGTPAGIIAVSVTRCFNPGDKIFVGNKEEDIEKLGGRVDQLMRENEHHWAKLECHPRLVAVMFHISTPADIQERLTRAMFTTIMPVGKPGEELELIRKALPERI